MDALGTNFTIACPAFPDNGRTIFKGYLFVGDELLHESGMRNHPLTPMLDSNLVRVLQAQTKRRVGLIDYKTVAAGSGAISKRIEQLQASGVSIAIVDATSNAELLQAGKAWKGMPLITAGSGIAIGLPQNYGVTATQAVIEQAAQLLAPQGLQAIVSGSCSVATNAQVAKFIAQGGSSFYIDPQQLIAGADLTVLALSWAKEQFAKSTSKPLLVYATSSPEQVKAVQLQLGVEKAGELIERTLSTIARGLVDLGVRQLVIAGGETSGACVQALGVTQLRIGPQIAPGVPWTHTGELHLALKSGNFGSVDFFSEAFELLYK